MLRRRAAGRHDGVGILVFQLIERERAAARNLDGLLHGRRPEKPAAGGVRRAAARGQRGEPLRDPPPRMQVTLAIGQQPVADLVDRAAMPHGSEGVEEGQSRPLVVADVTRGCERHLRPRGHAFEPLQAFVVVALERHLGQRPELLAKHLPPGREAGRRAGLVAARRPREGQHHACE
jgi:hypothetical protein